MTKYAWWGYAKAVIRKYPAKKRACDSEDLLGVALREYEAVSKAVEETEKMQDGEKRLAFVSMVFWERSHNIQGAAHKLYISERTAVRWHTAFIKTTARHLGLLD